MNKIKKVSTKKSQKKVKKLMKKKQQKGQKNKKLKKKGETNKPDKIQKTQKVSKAKLPTFKKPLKIPFKKPIIKHWGEFTKLKTRKVEVQDCYSIFPREKKERLEKIMPFDEPLPPKKLIIGNEIVTQTIELMNHTDTVSSWMDTYNDDSSYGNYPREPLPTITLSAETKSALDQINKPLLAPMMMSIVVSDFSLGKPKTHANISRPVALEAICKSLSGLLRLKGFHDCTESSLLMFMDGLEEFYKSFMEKINFILTNEKLDKNKTVTVESAEKAYYSLTSTSLLGLHNYYKSDIQERNRTEIIKFMNTIEEYEELADEDDNFQQLNMNDEYITLVDSYQNEDSSSSGSTQNDSDASSYKDSSFSYDKQQGSVSSDENSCSQFPTNPSPPEF